MNALERIYNFCKEYLMYKNIITTDFVKVENNVFTHSDVLLVSKCLIFKNVYEMIAHCISLPEYTVKCNLDDEDCCADGILTIYYKEKKVFSTFVPFDSEIHSKLVSLFLETKTF